MQKERQASAQGQGKQGQSRVPAELSSTSDLGTELVAGMVADEVFIAEPWFPLQNHGYYGSSDSTRKRYQILLETTFHVPACALLRYTRATTVPGSFLPMSVPMGVAIHF